MHVARIGFTPLKGGRHDTHESVQLGAGGPVGDRAFCLLDAATERCLRTIENPTLLATRASWDGVVLAARLPTGNVAGRPAATGEIRTVDYWGRTASVEVVEGPWAAAYSHHLGRDVVLASSPPGEIVYGAPVSLVTSASLAGLADAVSAWVDGARFRATFELDVGPLPALVENDWLGRRLRLGTAEIEVRNTIGRCGVIDLDPSTGTKDLAVLKTLSRRGSGELSFGVDAVVTVPGEVRTGDTVVPL